MRCAATHGRAACAGSAASSRPPASSSAASSAPNRLWRTWPSASAQMRRDWAAPSSASRPSSRRLRSLPAALVPSEPTAPDRAFEQKEVRDRIRAAIASLPPRERRVVALYYYGEATMKQIGAEIGVNESRVSQLHARAIQRLRKALGADCSMEEAARVLRPAILSFQQTMRRMRMAKVDREKTPAVVLPYKVPTRVENRARVRSSEPRVAAAR